MPIAPTDASAGWGETVAEHKRLQLLRIGRAAARLVAEEGVGAATMSAVARAAGISRATLYSYVPDVSTAIRLYLAAHAEDFYAAVEAAIAEETGPEPQLRRYIREQVAYAAGHDHHVAAALTVMGAVHPEPDSRSAHEKRHPEILERILDDGMRAGIFRTAPLGVHAALISRLLYSAPELMNHHHLTEAETAAVLTDLIVDGIVRASTDSSADAHR